MDGVIPGRRLLVVAEAQAVVTAGVEATADQGHPQRGSVELSGQREDLGAQGDPGIHHHHPKGGGTTAHHPMKEPPPHPLGTADTQGVGALRMTMLEERPPRLRRAPLKKMAAVSALRTMRALLVTMMRTVALRGAAIEFKHLTVI